MIFLCYEYCGNWNNKFQKNSNQNSLRGLTTLNDILLWKFVKSCGSQRKFWDSKWIQKSECIFVFFCIFCHLNFISDEPCEKLWNLVGESFEAQSEFTNLNGIFFHLWRRALNTNYFAKTCWGFSHTTLVFLAENTDRKKTQIFELCVKIKISFSQVFHWSCWGFVHTVCIWWKILMWERTYLQTLSIIIMIFTEVPQFTFIFV